MPALRTLVPDPAERRAVATLGAFLLADIYALRTAWEG